MAPTRPPSPGTVRDRGLGRLRRWTVAVGVASAGLVGLFAVLAFDSFPGHAGSPGSGTTSTSGSTSGAAPAGSSDTTSSAGSQTVPAPVQPQSPPEGFFGTGGGGPMVVSGGS
ncbi:MAG TPA: hypothetical protein VFD49_01370 [Candidatus Dormibacteraeota bacterium]|nr:hypothetical protein [Candidatus Dormibacteraeota bacterium]